MLRLRQNDRERAVGMVQAGITHQAVADHFKGIQAVRIVFFYIQSCHIRCFILIAVEILHNIIRK